MSVMKEFREFAARGNVVDLAVGVIIGAAFGVFLNTVLEFLIVAFIIFLMVRQLNRLKTPAPAPPTDDARDCPFCVSRISTKATRCPNCTSDLRPSRA
jgi:large conductance mechanosensitive channel